MARDAYDRTPPPSAPTLRVGLQPEREEYRSGRKCFKSPDWRKKSSLVFVAADFDFVASGFDFIALGFEIVASRISQTICVSRETTCPGEVMSHMRGVRAEPASEPKG